MKKIVGIFLITLMSATAFLPVANSLKINSIFVDQIDQVQDEGSFCKIASDSTSYGQSFKPTLPILTRVKINVAGHYKCSIRSQLTGQDLVSVTQNYPLSSEWRFFDFNPDLHVTPDETYYIVLIPQDDAFICYGENTGYTRGCLQISEDGGYTWGEPLDEDMQFITYGTSVSQGTVHNVDTNSWYNWIQDAIDDPSTDANDEIHVYLPDTSIHINGVYQENVVINKEGIILKAVEPGVIIDGGGTGNVVTISANHPYVEISGFKIQNSGPDQTDRGVMVWVRSEYADINNNNITNCNNGIFFGSNFCFIEDNEI